MSFSPQQERPVVTYAPVHQQRCQSDGCDGYMVRHSLGCGQSVYRCSRCFRRSEAAVTIVAEPGRFRRLIDEFVTWREDAD